MPAWADGSGNGGVDGTGACAGSQALHEVRVALAGPPHAAPRASSQNLYWRQDSILYHPDMQGVPKHPRDNPHPLSSPGDSGMAFKTLSIPTSDGELLHAWLITTAESQHAPTLVFLHGNAGNMGMRLPNAKLLHALTKCNILMVDYRGYGGSTGAPSEEGLGLDGEAVLDALSWEEGIDASKIVLFGRSLGGAVAVAVASATKHYTGTSLAEYAEATRAWTQGAGGAGPAAGGDEGGYRGAKRPLWVRALVLENTFTSITDMVQRIFPWWVQSLRPLVQRMFYPSIDRILHLRLPILFLSGSADQLIPPVHMRRLHDAADASVLRRFYLIEEGGHNDSWKVGGVAYYAQWRSFLQDACGHDIPPVEETVQATLGANKVRPGAGTVEEGSDGPGSDLLGDESESSEDEGPGAAKRRTLQGSDSGSDEDL